MGVDVKIDDILAFDATIHYGSVSRAAKILGLTQSTITRRVQNLEHDLGVELLSRDTRPARPTQLGMRVFEQARSALQQIDQITNLVSEQAEPTGPFRIGIPQFLSESIAISAIRHLQARFPDITIKMTTEMTPALLRMVAEGSLDTAIVVLPPNGALPSHLTGHRLAALTMNVVVPRGALSEREDLQLSDIHEMGWILNPAECGFRNGLNNALKKQGLPLVLNFDVTGVEVQLGLVASELGIGLIPSHMLESSTHKRRVEIITLSDFQLCNDLWLARPNLLGCMANAANELGLFVREKIEHHWSTSGASKL